MRFRSGQFGLFSVKRFVPLPRFARLGRSPWKLAISTFLLIIMTVNLIAQFSVSSVAQDIPKVLQMGTSADYKPFEFHDTSGGEDKIVGFDVDIARRLSEDLGFKLEIVDMDFNGLIPALQSQRVDFVMAGMTPTPERKRNIDFSQIYYEAKNTIIAKQNNSLTTIASLYGKTVGAQLGSTQEEAVKTMNQEAAKQKKPAINLVTRNRVSELIQEIKANRIDAAIVEDTVAQGYTGVYPDLQFSVIENNEGGYAIAFPKGSTLVAPFNKVLATMKKDGTLERFAKKWFEDQGKPAGIGFQQIIPSIPYILGGIGVTLAFTLVSAILGFIWAVVLALMKIAEFKPFRWLANAYTSVFRGTPLILQIALVYFATPQLVGYDIPAFQAGVIAFALNSGAYVSETLRAGILAVDKGQREAALSLGVPYRLMMTDIILPQALKNILPALANEGINLLKDSALVSTIGAADLLRRATVVGAEKYLYFEPLIIAAIVYYVMVMLLTMGTSVLEKRLQRSA
ncbi:ABC transporter substrate-binding protein/permease [Pantanalinema sp. GBBB05]|uniref:ABC transporter substrate-binding protein/permease n=1 Tax=Pantanalinema sp. GBBB05 TaxID=2604139 RepID=UPI003D817F8C